jgi:tetratricopeptide (TPR) repeat protein
MSSSSEKRMVICCLVLLFATLAFYNNIVHNQFVAFDTYAYILANSHVQRGLTWDTVAWSFTTFYQGNWHPLTWLSHALDCQMFHLNPIGHHYISLLFHAANAVLLFLLLWRATDCAGCSLTVAALFALHPVNVESVAWAAERKNVLSTLFFLLAMHAYGRYARGAGRQFYWLVCALFALGLMAKPQIVTLPFVLLLWDYWPLQRMNGPVAARDLTSPPLPRSFGFLVLEKLPLFLLAAADSVVTVFAQRAGDIVRPLSQVPLPLRLENAVVSYVRYIGKAFWPSALSPLYPRPEHLLPRWQVVAATGVLVVISVICFHGRAHRYRIVGWLWFLGTLVPMIGIVTVGDQAMADRYAYVSFIGLFIAVVWTLRETLTARGFRAEWLAAAAVILLAVLGFLTRRQLGYWHDDETLWRYTLSVTRRNYVAHNNLALALRQQGRAEESIAEFRAGNALHPYQPTQLLGLAEYELQAGHPREALEECEAVLRDSGEPASYAPAIRGAAAGEMGQAYLQIRNYESAAASFQNALRLNPDDAVALMGQAILAMHQGQNAAAVTLLQRAVQVTPGDVNVLLLAQALRRAGRVAEADAVFAQVRKVSADPMQAEAAAAKLLTLADAKGGE